MPLEKGMRATVSKRDAGVEPVVKPSSAGGEASMEDKGIAELFGGPGPTRISFVPWKCQRQLDEVLLLYTFQFNTRVSDVMGGRLDLIL